MNLAIDRAAVTRRLRGPGLSIPTCQVLPPHFPGYRAYCPWTRNPHDGRWYGPDIARARALVRASGTAGAAVTALTPVSKRSFRQRRTAGSRISANGRVSNTGAR